MDIWGFSISVEMVEVFKHLLSAAFLGMLLGLERVFAHKTAGLRTYGLVSLGSALFIVISTTVTAQYIGITPFDPLRMAAQVIAGIGFLAAGVIIVRGSRVEGLTTAAGLWVAAGIGVASGFGLYTVAAFTTIITLFIFTVMWLFEARVRQVAQNKNDKKS